MSTFHISCLTVDDYSYESVFEITVHGNEIVGKLMESIKGGSFDNVDPDTLRLLKVDISLDQLSDKLAFIENNPSADIKAVLGGEELISDMTVAEFFHKKYCIVIIPPFPLITFKRCIDKKQLVPGDKVIYKYSYSSLKCEIVDTFNGLQIRCIKDNEIHELNSFSKFIKLAISPSDIEGRNWKNLWIKSGEPKEKVVWHDFRRRMLNKNIYRDLEDRIRKLKLDSEVRNVIDYCTKDTPLNKMQTADDIVYNKIHLGTPNVFVNSKRMVGSDFFSVDSTILRGISASLHDEVEKLYKLLVNNKDEIDRVFESQPVYAIGPSFDRISFPYITCWVTSHLDPSILVQLENIFNYEYRVISQVIQEVEPMDENDLSIDRNITREFERDSNGDDGSGNNRSSNNRSNDHHSGGNDSSNDHSSDSNKDRDGNNDKDGNKGRDGEDDNNKFISVNSLVRVGDEDQQNIQTLEIRTRVHANINKNERTFFCHVDVAFGLSEMLNTKWKKLGNEGYGYFIESLKIEVVPITSDENVRSLIWEKYMLPEEKNVTVEHLTSTENQSIIEIAMNPKFEFQYKQVHSTKTTSDEWKLRLGNTSYTGFSWTYETTSNEPKIRFKPGSHICEGSILSEKLCGFHVIVTEILCFKFTTYFPRPSKFMVMKCPKIVHTLKMTFNNIKDLKDFNNKFATFGSVESYAEKVEGIFP